MRLGRLDRRITIQGATTTTNDLGQKKETWTTIAEVWAKIDQRPGKDSEKSESRFFSRPVTFVVRFRDDIGPDDRVSFDGKIYRIESVNEVHYSRRRWMNLRCVILGRQDG